MVNEADVGIVGGVNVGLPILMTMGAFLAIALYNVIELTFLIFAIFKQWRGLYFWSFLVATLGIVPHAVGFTLKFFQVTSLDLLSSAIVGVGFVCMVPGQSVVLYSRLHLVVRDARRIRWVLYMIIFDTVAFALPLFVLALGTSSNQSARFLPGFLIYDKIQIVIFSVQEAIISIIYIYETVHLLGQGSNNSRGPLRKLLGHLIFVNVMVLVFDITLLAVQFSGHYEIQTTYKTAIYSVKLKIEFSVLNRLVHVVKNNDLISRRTNPWANALSLSRWTSSKKTQFSTSPGGCNSFVKMNDIGSRGEGMKRPTVTTTGVNAEQGHTVGFEDKGLDLGVSGRRTRPPESVHFSSHSIR